MIRNDRQLSIAKEKQAALLGAASTAGPRDATVYHDLANEVQQEIDEYVAIRDGHVNLFAIESVDDLAAAVVKARVARRWTQKQLAESLGVSEQMVQKDDSHGYEKAGVSRLAEVVDVLGYQLVGELRPIHLPPDQWKGPDGFVIGLPSGSWAIESPSAEFKFTIPKAGMLRPGGSLSGLLVSIADAINIRFGSEIIGPSPFWERETQNGSQSLVKGLSREG